MCAVIFGDFYFIFQRLDAVTPVLLCLRVMEKQEDPKESSSFLARELQLHTQIILESFVQTAFEMMVEFLNLVLRSQVSF